MSRALPPEEDSSLLPRPNGIVSVRIDPKTGLRADPTDPNAIFEIFREEYAPAENQVKKGEDAGPFRQIF